MWRIEIMPLRIESAVRSGEIDNTVEGKTTGLVWLVGRDEPVLLRLVGDCWRDLAGTRLKFRNPDPRPGPAKLEENSSINWSP